MKYLLLDGPLNGQYTLDILKGHDLDKYTQLGYTYPDKATALAWREPVLVWNANV